MENKPKLTDTVPKPNLPIAKQHTVSLSTLANVFAVLVLVFCGLWAQREYTTRRMTIVGSDQETQPVAQILTELDFTQF